MYCHYAPMPLHSYVWLLNHVWPIILLEILTKCVPREIVICVDINCGACVYTFMWAQRPKTSPFLSRTIPWTGGERGSRLPLWESTTARVLPWPTKLEPWVVLSSNVVLTPGSCCGPWSYCRQPPLSWVVLAGSNCRNSLHEPIIEIHITQDHTTRLIEELHIIFTFTWVRDYKIQGEA